MSIKILGGVLKGMLIPSPKSDETRPTSVMLRRRIFDSHQDMSGVLFYDLCAGTGAMGFEALSRGSHQVTFIEKNRSAILQIEKVSTSLKDPKLSSKVKIINADVIRWIMQFKKEYQSLDEETKLNTTIFLDPPYESHQIYQEIILSQKIFEWFHGKIWVEGDVKKGVPLSFFKEVNSHQTKELIQGDSYLLVFSA